MSLNKGLTGLAGGIALTVIGAFAQAADYSHETYQTLLAEGRTTAARDMAAGALEDKPNDQQAQFALGAAEFFLAIERLGQGLYRYGLKTQYNPGLGLAEVPFLRLPIPINPEPEPVAYDALRAVLARFVDDLAVAEATLAGVTGEAFDFPLDLATIRLDFDGDGAGSAEETVLAALGAVSPRVASESGFAVDFDQSDAPWLRGYTHLLSAMANFPLAHDWEAAFLASFHGLFPDTELPGSEMNVEIARVMSAIKELNGDQFGRVSYPRRPGGEPPRPRRGNMEWEEWQEALREYEESEAYQQYLNSDAYKAYEREMARYREYQRLRDALEFGAIADLVAFLHLFNWPVVEPERMAAVRTHLLEMIALSRENWQRIQAEADDKREWVPGPAQTGIFQRMRVDEETVANWHTFLDEFEAILNGERLIKHWRFTGRGINMRRMFEEPSRFDPWLIGQGSAIIPYLEEGDIVTGDTAWTMFELFGGDFFAYFIWFN